MMVLRSWVTAVLDRPDRPVRVRRLRRNARLAVEALEDRRTPTSASMVEDIMVGAGDSDPSNLVNVNGTLYFTTDDGAHGLELWKSDGTAAGTVMVKDINAGAGSANPRYLTAVNGTLFFQADDGANGQELWKSDGTAPGTVMVMDINPGAANSETSRLADVNGTLFFTAADGINGRELWKSDGTTAGTVLVKDINAGAGNSNLDTPVNVNGTLFFAANDGINGRELWKSDGTEAGTVMVRDINPGLSGSFLYLGTNVNGTLFFRARDAAYLTELWKSDGTEAGTVMVKDINPGSASYPVYLTNVNGTVFFQANGPGGDAELYRSDGTPEGTVRVKNINVSGGSSSPSWLTNVGGTLFFSAFGPGGAELWKSDGTDAGTVRVKDINPNLLGNSSPNGLTNVNGTLFFSADDGAGGRELWKSDGTEAGTVIVQDINAGATGSSPSSLININGTLFFVADDGANGAELWKATEFSDDFNRADSTSLGAGWTEAPIDLAIVGNQLMAIGVRGGTALVSGVSLADARVVAQVSLLTTGNSRAELLLRAQTPTAAYFGSLVGNNGTVTAYIKKGGRILASAPVAAPLGTGVLRFEAAGSLLKLFFNDTLVASAVDTAYKSGKVGVRGTQFVSFEDFFVSPVDPQMPFGDSFNRHVDSTSLGSQWREQTGDLAVIGNQVVAIGTGNNIGIHQWAVVKDVSVQANVNAFSPAGSGLTGSAGVIARYTGPVDKNYYLGALVGVNGVFTARIYRNLNGRLAQLASAPIASGNGLLRFEVIGNSLKLFVNNVLAVKTTDIRLAGPGQVGVRGTPRATFDTVNAQQVFPTLFYDGFNRPNADNLGRDWKALRGHFSVVGNLAGVDDPGTNLTVRDGIMLKDVRLEATVVVGSAVGFEAGLVARVKDVNNYYYAALETVAGGGREVSIYKVVNNVRTRIGAAGTVGSGSGKLRFDVMGNSLKLYFDDALMVDVTDTTFAAAGLAGLRGIQNANFDDFIMA